MWMILFRRELYGEIYCYREYGSEAQAKKELQYFLRITDCAEWMIVRKVLSGRSG